MKFIYIYINNKLNYFFLEKTLFIGMYKYIYKHFLKITKFFLLWKYYNISDPLYLDYLTTKFLTKVLFPYKLYFFKKKKIFKIKLLINNNYKISKINFYFFSIFFKLLNLKKKFFFFLFFLNFFRKKNFDFFQLFVKKWLNIFL